MSLPKHIIKKYGISKKAWAIFRNVKQQSKRVNTMRRKKSKATSRRTSKSGMNQILSYIIPVAYGYLRPQISNAIPPIKGISNYSDEIVIGGGAILAKMLIKNPTVKSIATPIFNIELAKASEKMYYKIPLNGNTASSSSQIYL